MRWETVREYEDITFRRAEGIARIAINRPEVRNAFRPQTVMELIDAFARAREDSAVGVVILTGEGGEAFCSGGDQRVRGEAGYVGGDGVPRLNILDVQHKIRYIHNMRSKRKRRSRNMFVKLHSGIGQRRFDLDNCDLSW